MTEYEGVDELVAAVEREWRREGVSRSDRATLAADLRGDLEAAMAAGGSPDELIGPDVRMFARHLADEAGLRRVPPEYARVTAVGALGGLLGLVGGVLLVFGLLLAFTALFDNPFRPPVLLSMVVIYGGIAACPIVGAAVAVRRFLSDVPRIRSTANRLAITLPVLGALGGGAAVGLGHASGYSLQLPVLAGEILLVLLAFVAAILLARRWSLTTRALRTSA